MSEANMLEILSTIMIEHVYPEIDSGRYPIKRVGGDRLEVTADIYKEGHDVIGAVVRYKTASERIWRESPMHHVGNDRWVGSFDLTENTRYLYTIGAFMTRFESWRQDVIKKREVQTELSSELLEGEAFVRAAAKRARAEDREQLESWLARWNEQRDHARRLEMILRPEFAALIRNNEERLSWTLYDRELRVVVDRRRARVGAWYEMFPRSQGATPGRGSTFRECEARLAEIQAMGFDVVYLPPIHPIGRTNRKGPNNAVKAGPNDPGSPYAIGNERGGFDAIEPSLGTFEDFDHFHRAVHDHGLELALDFAINCSPDHPYVIQHPEWFYHRPDGTIKFAENPPKKYEDVYPLNFYCEQWREIWEEMKRVILFWCARGVKIFRVDNPHTKPVAFWEWLIREVQQRHPDVIFLSEAFTRPPMMRMLAKVGFSQSYTYFTWRNFKHELTEYLVELTQSEMKEYFRPNFFTNTPDILPEILQIGGRPAFKSRLVLAATLSPTYGIYNGYELCENRAIPGTEEYLDSEKYDFKVWDWDRPENIKDYITLVNRIRRENPALSEYLNLRFYEADNEHILFYGKTSCDGGNTVLVAVNLNPFHPQAAQLRIPIHEFGIRDDEPYQMHDLLTDTRALVKGGTYRIQLNPQDEPAAIFALRRWARREQDFDYFF